MYIDILRCGIDRWTNQWGDPFWEGLIITAAFVLSAGLSGYVATKLSGRERLFWTSSAIAASVFAANTHLDLHILPNAFGRCAASAQGWTHLGQTVQAVFVVTAFLVGGGVAASIAWVFRSQFRTHVTVFIGFCLILGALAVKGAGVRIVERAAEISFGPVALAEAPDLIGAALIVLGALVTLRRTGLGRSGKIFSRGDATLQVEWR